MPRMMLAGWVVSGLVGAVMIVSGSAKLFGFAPAQVAETLQSVGLSQQIVGLLEVSTALIYLVPRTSSAGTLLVCSFWGGAIVTHFAAGDGEFLIPLILGGLTWVGAYLRVPGAFASFATDTSE